MCLNEWLSGDAPETLKTSIKWSRPDAQKLNPLTDPLVFQQIDIDHYVGQAKDGMPGAKEGPCPVMRMFGITENGASVMCHVHGFAPYFYIQPPSGFKSDECKSFMNSLNKMVLADMRSNNENIVNAVLAVELVKKQSIYGFKGNSKVDFLKIIMALPRLVAPAVRLLERNNPFSSSNDSIQSYESNIDFEIRFMVDTNVTGCNWIEVPAGSYTVRNQDEMESRCQIEVDVAYNKFIPYEPEGRWSTIAPFRVLSFDIECAGRKGIFPEPEIDPVIQIANMVIRQGEKEPFLRVIFTLKECAPIVGVEVKSFDDEKKLLNAWADFVREVDPDILTGNEMMHEK